MRLVGAVDTGVSWGLEFLAGKISWGRMAGSGIPKALWF